MADIKGTHSPHRHTSEVADFPEVKDKLVENIEVFSNSEYYAITIRFQDRTALNIALETAVFAFPVLSDWTDGEQKILKEYKSVRSHIQRL